MTTKIHPIIYEPTTAITDFVIFFMGCYYGWVIVHISDSIFHMFWAISFITLAVGALLGGISHGFGPMLSKIAKMIIWRLTLLFIGLTALGLLLSALTILTNGKVNIGILSFFVILFAYYNYKVFKNDSFLIAIKFYLPFIIISLICFSYIFIYRGYTGALFISVGLLVTLFASLIQLSKIVLHKHFNHNDLFHIVQIIGMYLMFEGGQEIPKI
jgi:hypothetical protein